MRVLGRLLEWLTQHSSSPGPTTVSRAPLERTRRPRIPAFEKSPPKARPRIPAWTGDSLVRLSELGRLHGEHILAFKGFSRRTWESYDLSHRQFLAWLLAHGYQDDLRSFDAENVGVE